jgi:pimeloyl-ACP methyl ester carboxylesterase
MTESLVESGYAPVNGLRMYYEIHGAGKPLVLLHGGLMTISLWGPILEALAENHEVVAVEFQGHGHTVDIDRPFGYEAFADDVDALMEHLGIAQADIVGDSMGANTGLRLAIQHPDRVRKLVAISPNYRYDGYYPEAWDAVAALTPEQMAGSPFEAAYLEVAPDPAGFATLIERIKELDAKEYAWADEEIQSITSPVLVMIGDSDHVRPEHSVALFRLLGGGVPGDLTGLPASQLAILPGTTHLSIVFEKTDRLVSMIEAFLAAPIPEEA